MMARTAEIERHVQALADRDEAPTHLTSGTELARHLGAVGRGAAYRTMAEDFGLDPALVPDDDSRPGLLFAEQPGCWLTARDRIRVRLLEALVDRGWFSADRSGVFALANDRFTGDGDKGLYLAFELGAGLATVRILGSAYIRRHNRHTYASLVFDGPARDRLATILDVSRTVLRASGQDEDTFVSRMHALRADGIPDGLEPLYPPQDEPERLAELRIRLTEYDALAAAELLDRAADELREGGSWQHFWDAINAGFLGLPVQRLGPHLNRLLLAVRDPERMGAALASVLGRGSDEPAPVAGIARGDGIHRMVWYDPARRGFFLLQGEDREVVSWDQVRRIAAKGGTAGPSGVLVYLFLAATGHYLVVDPEDGFHPFHARVCATHALYTGLPFPWITFPARAGGAAAEANAFLDAYHARFDERTRAILTTFLPE